ncbi:DUF397 domain-containing protein [Streptomyces sp. NEAU-W12]|nr:DUF397 domain-containing protein [Streptomyces sp. NEAU-W12]MCX2922912.1 DUF397 domain-containing protein [Streptomyces sp. NEAU-W12]
MNTSESSWSKSAYSSSGSGDCAEVALPWRTSRYSSSGDGVEVVTCPATVHVRDSKNQQGPRPALSPTAWTGFLAHLTNRPAAPLNSGLRMSRMRGCHP